MTVLQIKTSFLKILPSNFRKCHIMICIWKIVKVSEGFEFLETTQEMGWPWPTGIFILHSIMFQDFLKFSGDPSKKVGENPCSTSMGPKTFKITGTTQIHHQYKKYIFNFQNCSNNHACLQNISYWSNSVLAVKLYILDIYVVLMLRSFTQKIKAGEDIDCEIESGPRSFKRPAGYMTLYTNWNLKKYEKEFKSRQNIFFYVKLNYILVFHEFFFFLFLHVFIRNDPRWYYREQKIWVFPTKYGQTHT